MAMSDKIEEIRERHAQSASNYIEFESTWDIHADRATLLAEVDRLRADVERLTGLSKQLAEGLGDEIRRFDDELLKNDRLDAENDRLLAEIERLREALRWYADQRNHFPVEHRRPGDPDPAVIFVEEPPIMIDVGKRARKALEGEP